MPSFRRLCPVQSGNNVQTCAAADTVSSPPVSAVPRLYSEGNKSWRCRGFERRRYQSGQCTNGGANGGANLGPNLGIRRDEKARIALILYGFGRRRVKGGSDWLSFAERSRGDADSWFRLNFDALHPDETATQFEDRPKSSRRARNSKMFQHFLDLAGS